MTNATNESKLRAAVVGCRMGANHAKAVASLPDYELVALCDLNEETAHAVNAEITGGAAVYTDYAAMLQDTKPDVVIIATPTGTHARFTLQAAEAGVKGVYCEKPMAVHLGDARRMLVACRDRGVPLVIGHQRRMSVPYRTMRKHIEDGAIGSVYLLRASCAGDFLSDGTHSVDSLLYLMSDAPVKWVLAAMFRQEVEPGLPDQWDYSIFTGRRYGHLVESGMLVTLEFEGGARAEFFVGDARLPGRGYQDIEIFGSKGRLWRAGDGAQPPVLVQDEAAGGYRPAENVPDASDRDIQAVFHAFAQTVRTGATHPLDAGIAIRTHEIVMAAYESARLGRRIELPLDQERFPLDIMLEEGNL
ncbi:putative dehydrogenase [Paenibacillus rhizosphaerae]|uniref:Putative dehydrogenase n=1 Tax=Paenibacillus rhizosphaerae TaxID=297318 RepID=A0A839TT31_9BACL|nr:Gfo/Idh/MocA family oxidoreductase [Paenibacillus rhizosphaerae]MBB3128439.1 putative dehydrogenase [Paenibacillus rhizosphaerae]